MAAGGVEAGAAAQRNQKQDTTRPQQAQQPRTQPPPHPLPLGFNALLHTDFLWQLQHRYVETTPLRPPVLVMPLHRRHQEEQEAEGFSLATAGNRRSSTAVAGSRASGDKQHKLHQHHANSLRQARTNRRRLQSPAGGSAGAINNSPATATKPLCTSGAAKGEWVRLPEGARDCPPGLCTGPLSPLLYGSPDNLAIDFHDVYVPHNCQYKLYTPDEAAACLGGRRLALVGDSRAHELHWYMSMHYPRAHAHVQYQLLLPYRVGVRALLAVEAQRRQRLAEEQEQQQKQQQAGATTAAAAAAAAPSGDLGLRELMMGHEVLALSSELHDIADFEHAAPDYLTPYGLDPGPPCLRVSVAVAAAPNSTNCTNCNSSLASPGCAGGSSAVEALHPGGAPVGAQCAPDTPEHAQLPKWRPVAQYLDALSQLVTTYQELRAELHEAGLLRVRRVLWLLPGYRPAATPTCLPNQLERMLCLQQWELAQVAGRAGWEVVDLGTMGQDAPAAWWSDDVHVSHARSGLKRTHSGVQMMELQALLNDDTGPSSSGDTGPSSSGDTGPGSSGNTGPSSSGDTGPSSSGGDGAHVGSGGGRQGPVEEESAAPPQKRRKRAG
ncbi:hypothetical protein HYH02_006860 [Chlamydomonas schloesseri]|uniref:Uncharacterized protein n=1 Tax=Chlamydomonas schloesseri TaxID=2026947 RepID=A0A835WJK5_9CHLO|nr:hypothetical protein HYH02_006860 [Chlamydomonas schloesseri]|eukprot:KAG2448276.1 hypothetical protein HYH02_006860 [Chlamydomonas schloesseri]